MEEERPGLFGKSGAYGQVFSLYTMASAAGVFLGPLWTSFAYGDHSWTVLVSSLGGFCASVALPLVNRNHSISMALRVYAKQTVAPDHIQHCQRAPKRARACSKCRLRRLVVVGAEEKKDLVTRRQPSALRLSI